MEPGDLEPRRPGALGRDSRDVRWVFIGPQGIRAGWSIALFGGLAAGLFIAINIFLAPALAAHIRRGGEMAPLAGLVFETLQFLAVLGATVIMAAIERRSPLAYGYQGKARAVRFVSGVAWGLIALTALVFSLWKLGYLVFTGHRLGGAAAVDDALLWGAVFLLTGFFEESLMRGYAQFTLMRGIGFWWGAFLLSIAFGSIHSGNGGESPIGLLSAGGVGLVFCISLWYTESLWWAVGFHAAWDWGQSYFYGTADSGMVARGHLFSSHPAGALLWSGGTTGPEGSVLVLPLLAVIAAAMFLWWGRRTQSPFAGAGWRPMRPATPAAVEAPPGRRLSL